MTGKENAQRMEKIVSLCKRRGFIFQSSEIYGGLNGVWDYGPLGTELKRNLKEYWWRVMVRERDDVVGMDGAILTHRAVLKASGHEDTFSDPLVECGMCRRRFRSDQIAKPAPLVATVNILFEDQENEVPQTRPFRVGGDSIVDLKKKARIQFEHDVRIPAKILSVEPEPGSGTPLRTGCCPHCGGEISEPRPFNLMLKTSLGATEGESSLAYLRPETAQSIFTQFKNVLDTARKKLPFGIAQIGKAFRNEINPRNYIFRSREFEQMELEYFCRPEQGMELLEYWKEERLKFYENIGIARDKLHVLTVPDADRAFYSKGTYDIEYDFPFGRQELEGVAYRTDYDLSQHQKASGKSLEYFDEETKQKFIPHVVEPSAGVDRTVLALLCNAYDEETVI